MGLHAGAPVFYVATLPFFICAWRHLSFAHFCLSPYTLPQLCDTATPRFRMPLTRSACCVCTKGRWSAFVTAPLTSPSSNRRYGVSATPLYPLGFSRLTDTPRYVAVCAHEPCPRGRTCFRSDSTRMLWHRRLTVLLVCSTFALFINLFFFLPIRKYVYSP